MVQAPAQHIRVVDRGGLASRKLQRGQSDATYICSEATYTCEGASDTSTDCSSSDNDEEGSWRAATRQANPCPNVGQTMTLGTCVWQN